MRIERFTLAWKAATRIEARVKTLPTGVRVRVKVQADGLLTRWEVRLVEEKARFEAATKPVCRSIVGRTIEAMMSCYGRA